jgi:hypothetical protein
MIVTVGEETGIGGRNQEFALSVAQNIAGSKNIVVGSENLFYHCNACVQNIWTNIMRGGKHHCAIIMLARLFVSSGEILGIGRISREYKGHKMIYLNISADNSWKKISAQLVGLYGLWKGQFRGLTGKEATQLNAALKKLDSSYDRLDKCMFWLYELLR